MIFWLTVLPLGALILFILVARTLRRLRPTRVDSRSYDFTIEQLLRLHQAGQLSAEEFERAKAEVLARRAVEPDDSTRRGFEVVPARPAAIQSLEDRQML